MRNASPVGCIVTMAQNHMADDDAVAPDPLATFNEYRSLLFSIAYRMVGTVADSEDIVQDAFIRWQQAPRDETRSPKAFLSRSSAGYASITCSPLVRGARNTSASGCPNRS